MKTTTLKQFIALLILTLLFSYSYADDSELKDLNADFDDIYNTGDYFYEETTHGNFNYTTYNTYQVPCYGEPHGDTKMVGGSAEPRFLGYNEFGESVPNPRFPYDSSTGKAFSEMNWYENPWKADDVKKLPRFRNIERTYFDNENLRPTFKKSFLESMQERYGTGDNPRFDIDRDRDFPWERYYHIVLPPTQNTYGVALLFHRDNAGVWYIEVPLKPLPPEVDTPEITIVIPSITLNGQPVGSPLRVTLSAGESRTVEAPDIPDYTYRGYGHSDGSALPPLISNVNISLEESHLHGRIEPVSRRKLSQCLAQG